MVAVARFRSAKLKVTFILIVRTDCTTNVFLYCIERESGDATGCSEIKLRTDPAKFINVRIKKDFHGADVWPVATVTLIKSRRFMPSR